MPQLARITRDPAAMGGKPCIRGIRVTVGTVVGFVAAGRTRDKILRENPYLEAEDIAEALSPTPHGGRRKSTSSSTSGEAARRVRDTLQCVTNGA